MPDIFAPPKNPKTLLLPASRTPCQTKLPEDCHYQPENLIKLFLLPNVMVWLAKHRPSHYFAIVFLCFFIFSFPFCVIFSEFTLLNDNSALGGGEEKTQVTLPVIKKIITCWYPWRFMRRITVSLFSLLILNCRNKGNGFNKLPLNLYWVSEKKILMLHLFCYVHIPGETSRQQHDDYEHGESWGNDNVYDDDDGPFDDFGNDQSDAEDTNTLISQPRQVCID